ncbi:MAG: hypothetical protein EHM72_16765 [Calditrichaeota bacterium]|nr:MAG: hypothetical protein EHM72_16765 [Calditrichota bacterium]
MKKNLNFLLVLLLSFSASSSGDISLSLPSFQLSLDRSGSVCGLVDGQQQQNYLAQDVAAPLLRILVAGEMRTPISARYDSINHTLLLVFADGTEATIQVVFREKYLTLELSAVTNPEKIELVVWGPYPTSLGKVIGETVGVVQGENFALSIQALNPKTLGGYPWNENDCMPQLDIFDQDDLSDMSEQGKRYVLYRVEAAKPENYGSSLQAYCRNRNQERIVANWDHDRYTAPPYDDGGVIGSKIALFGCAVADILDTIAAIEITEGLPHPTIDGTWGKIAPSASAAYIIMEFGEKDIERAIAVTQKAGLRYLYHPGPFENWGHFDLNHRQFPNGVEGLKQCVDKARSQGIYLGVHTLSNFITLDDPYVTPIPDPRLAKVGTTLLVADITSTQTDIPIASPDFFNQFNNNHLRTCVIGSELIRYGQVSESAPWRLLECSRGAFNTQAASHAQGDSVSKLADHAYRVFLTNPELSIEVAQNIAELFNETGLRQISFDGLEGNRSTGLGNYGEILFTQAWYDHLTDDIRQHYIADASRTSHFFWHMYTRMNWGEPWYAGFRESQTDYRLKNQAYFKRNLMPAMLGWFKMTAETSVEDIEWMLARSAAFNAGYAFVVSPQDLAQNGDADQILGLLGQWERARMADVFSDEQKKQMQDIQNEFHLSPISADAWALTRVHSFKFTHERKVRQPGEPLYSRFSFNNPVEEKEINFILSAEGGDISDIILEFDHHNEIRLPVTLRAGEKLKYDGGPEAIHYNVHWRPLERVAIEPSRFTVSQGEHELLFDCRFDDGKDVRAKLEIRISDHPQSVSKKMME